MLKFYISLSDSLSVIRKQYSATSMVSLAMVSKYSEVITAFPSVLSLQFGTIDSKLCLKLHKQLAAKLDYADISPYGCI